MRFLSSQVDDEERTAARAGERELAVRQALEVPLPGARVLERQERLEGVDELGVRRGSCTGALSWAGPAARAPGHTDVWQDDSLLDV